ncbi:type IV pilin protein [Psychrobacter sp. DWR1-2-3]|uniref:type IV pilin protein n=1 Tax=Psychrobacter sp. DWR1-2-3 TaxID=2804637 RepID=UPI003CE79070
MNMKALKQQVGFTLIELMIVIMIVAILAAIAVPSYRQFVVRNAESQVQARMQELDIELNRWRASALTYKGFTPKKVASNGDVSYAYDETDNKTIYVPKGSDSTNFHYKITLVDASTGNTLAPASSGYSMAGSSWRMFAEPNTSFKKSDAHILMISSRGVKCKSKDRTITAASTDCGTGKESW